MAMTSKPRVLRSVSDTALLVAYHRAMETKRPDALFKDEFAVRLSEGRGEQIARKLARGRALAWTTIVRTVLLDDVVLRLVAQGVDTVVNLAAGLDATAVPFAAATVIALDRGRSARPATRKGGRPSC